MTEHRALQEAAQAGEVLKQAVLDFLDQYYEDDISGSRPSWPTELERLTGWKEPEGKEDS